MPRGLATKTLTLIEAAHEILAEIQPTTVRGVCYKLFVAGHLPDMSKNSTNRAGTALVTARETGRIPWSWIVDEHRSIERIPGWSDPIQFVEAVRNAYRKDWWNSQPKRVVVVSEKGTVRGVLKPVLDELGVEFLALHGYSSATVLYDLARQTERDERETYLLYVGDFDPSGRHMSDVDLPGRLWQYGAKGFIQRIALNHDDRKDLPGFSAVSKSKDARYQWFVDQFGDRCAELDALDPRTLRDRVREAISEHIDWATWHRTKAIEDVELASVQSFVTDWQQLFSGPPDNRIGGAT